MDKKMKFYLTGLVLFLIPIFTASCSTESKLNFPYYGAFTIVDGKTTEIPKIMGEPRIEDVINDDPIEIDFENNQFYLWWPEVDFDTLYMVPLDDYSYIVDYNVIPLENEILQISPRETLQPGIYCLAQGGYLKSPIEVPFWCFQVKNKETTSHLENNSSKRCLIAFISDRDGDNEIFVMDMDGSNQTQLTFNDIDENKLLWSPDGTRITFRSSFRNGDEKFFVIYADGSNQTQIGSNVHYAFQLDWSPDGKSVAFVSTVEGYFKIFIMNADGSKLTQLTSSNSDKCNDNQPKWSPDGNHIAFFSNCDGDNEIFVMDKDGSNQTQLTFNDNEDMFQFWSPDGKYIAFVSDRDGDLEIFIMDADGSNQTQLTSNYNDIYDFAWSPDGKYIAFTSNRDGDPEIFIMDADGSNQTQLTSNDNYYDMTIDWSPDGKYMAFVSDRDGDPEIFIMDADGSNQTQLTSNNMVDYSPSWSFLCK